MSARSKITGPGALARRHHRRTPIALPEAQVEAVECLQNGRLGPRQLEPQLRLAMDRTPKADHIRLQRLGFGKQCGDRHVPDATLGHQRPSTTVPAAWQPTHPELGSPNWRHLDGHCRLLPVASRAPSLR
jgi:hypothetical protein